MKCVVDRTIKEMVDATNEIQEESPEDKEVLKDVVTQIIGAMMCEEEDDGDS